MEDFTILIKNLSQKIDALQASNDALVVAMQKGFNQSDVLDVTGANLILHLSVNRFHF